MRGATTSSPFHAAERAVQSRLGVRESIEPWARRVIQPAMSEQHRAFYEALPYVVVAARDAQGRPWASLLAARPGFAQAVSAVELDLSQRPSHGDALEHAFSAGADVGLLGIDLATRRRNRLNGRIAATRSDGFTLAVDQAFGNCPQYITTRGWEAVAPEETRTGGRRLRSLSTALGRWIESADTCFLATGHRGEGEDPAFGMDASHRGGEAGFVRVTGDRRLTFPDHPGNNHFNTIGNLVADSRIGLLFVDFRSGSLLQLTGRAEIAWGKPALGDFPGAERLVRVEVDEAIERRNVLPMRWLDTRGEARRLRILERVNESTDVVSLLLGAEDGAPLADFEAGQHLPVEVEIPGRPARVERSYSLSSAPGDPHYRISVKREAHGLASRYLHDQLAVGDLLTARPPGGSFSLQPGTRAIALISAGIGATPMLSMLHSLAAARDERTLCFIHGARDAAHHVFAAEVDQLLEALPNGRRHVAYSRPAGAPGALRKSDSLGRIDAEKLEALLCDFTGDVYLCGPPGFMAEIQHALERLGTPPARIHYESFGPAAGD